MLTELSRNQILQKRKEERAKSKKDSASNQKDTNQKDTKKKTIFASEEREDKNE